MLIADTHTHLHFTSFENDREDVLKKNRDAGVELQVLIGCDEFSSLAALDLAKQHDDLHCTLGLHPCDVRMEPNRDFFPEKYQEYELKCRTIPELFDFFSELYQDNQEHIVAFGETGFDRYHDSSDELLKIQEEALDAHVQLAKQFGKPLIFHLRDGWGEFWSFLDQGNMNGIPGIVHCFGEGALEADVLTRKFGFFLGIGGILTYPKSEALREAVKRTPIEFLITETDAPFLIPQSKRATEKRNESRFLDEVITLIAELKGLEVEACAEILFANAKRAFRV